MSIYVWVKTDEQAANVINDWTGDYNYNYDFLGSFLSKYGKENTIIELSNGVNRWKRMPIYDTLDLGIHIRSYEEHMKSRRKDDKIVLPKKVYDNMNECREMRIPFSQYACEYPVFNIEDEDKLMKAWLNLDEVTVINNLWVVRTTEDNASGTRMMVSKSSKHNHIPLYTSYYANAWKFETKEEAEKWVTPNTEAVPFKGN